MVQGPTTSLGPVYCGDLVAEERSGGSGYPYHAVQYRVVTGDNARY